jgi:hypothetical protein
MFAASIFSAAPPAQAADTVLLRAELFTQTGGDNKDHDTCVWATVTSSDGGTVLAKVGNGDCGGDDSTTYNDNSPHTIKMNAEAGVSKDLCKGFKVHLWQKTHGGRGHDTWRIQEARVTLYFNDGGNLFAKTDGPVALVSNSPEDAPGVDFVQHGQ